MRASRWRVCGVPGAGQCVPPSGPSSGRRGADLPVGRVENRLADALDHGGRKRLHRIAWRRPRGAYDRQRVGHDRAVLGSVTEDA